MFEFLFSILDSTFFFSTFFEDFLIGFDLNVINLFWIGANELSNLLGVGIFFVDK